MNFSGFSYKSYNFHQILVNLRCNNLITCVGYGARLTKPLYTVRELTAGLGQGQGKDRVVKTDWLRVW